MSLFSPAARRGWKLGRCRGSAQADRRAAAEAARSLETRPCPCRSSFIHIISAIHRVALSLYFLSLSLLNRGTNGCSRSFSAVPFIPQPPALSSLTAVGFLGCLGCLLFFSSSGASPYLHGALGQGRVVRPRLHLRRRHAGLPGVLGQQLAHRLAAGRRLGPLLLLPPPLGPLLCPGARRRRRIVAGLARAGCHGGARARERARGRRDG